MLAERIETLEKCGKSDVFFQFLDRYISNMEFDLSFLEKMDIELLIKKFEQLCANSYINFMTNDIRKKANPKTIRGVAVFFKFYKRKKNWGWNKKRLAKG